MKINTTKKQYYDLLRSLYLADWMANAICDTDEKKDKNIGDLLDYFFSFAKDFGCEDLVDYDKKEDKYYSSINFEDNPSVRNLIEKYDEYVFWEKLIDKFGEKDFFEKYRKNEIEKMDQEERFIKRMECEEKWGRRIFRIWN